MKKDALLLTSSAPLPNEMIRIKRLYWICLACLIIGGWISFFFAIGILGLIVIYLIDYYAVSLKQAGLRKMKFKYDNKMTQCELLEKLQPILLSQYGDKIIFEKNNDGLISISFNKHIYDVYLYDDDTMSLYWRKSLSGAFFSVNNYKSYKQNLNSMGIIVYEIQKCCGIN